MNDMIMKASHSLFKMRRGQITRISYDDDEPVKRTSACQLLRDKKQGFCASWCDIGGRADCAESTKTQRRSIVGFPREGAWRALRVLPGTDSNDMLQNLGMEM